MCGRREVYTGYYKHKGESYLIETGALRPPSGDFFFFSTEEGVLDEPTAIH